jgi:hypothetical protein
MENHNCAADKISMESMIKRIVICRNHKFTCVTEAL